MLVLELALPVVLIAALVLVLYLRLKRPSPLPLGCIIPKVCVVGPEEILRSNGTDEYQREGRLRWQARWKQFRVNWGYVGQMAENTTLFQRTLRFDEMRIASGKLGMDYAPRETAVLVLAGEAAQVRWQLFRSRIMLVARLALGLRIRQRALVKLLERYKELEHSIIALTAMADEECYQEMLIERLGLANWKLIDGGGSTA